jgi:peptidyl-prolyl cis-trans isomerase C
MESVLFNGTYVGLCRQLVKSRFGFHIPAVDRRESGQLMSFDPAREHIVACLEEHSRRAALARYVSRLAAGAPIVGADLCRTPGPTSPREQPPG